MQQLYQRYTLKNSIFQKLSPIGLSALSTTIHLNPSAETTF